jgi:hypothetical protein
MARGMQAASTLEKDSDGVDFLRGVALLQTGDVLGSRQALLEHLRVHPGHGPARELLAQVQSHCGAFLALPPALAEAEELFALLFGALMPHTMLHWPRMLNLHRLARGICGIVTDDDVVAFAAESGAPAVLAPTEPRLRHVRLITAERKDEFALSAGLSLPADVEGPLLLIRDPASNLWLVPGAAVAGDVVECGVAGGGSTIMMAATLRHCAAATAGAIAEAQKAVTSALSLSAPADADADALNRSAVQALQAALRPEVTSVLVACRMVHACDSYAGMPPPTHHDTLQRPPPVAAGGSAAPAPQAHWGTGTCSSSVDHVRRLATQFAVADRVRPVVGYFQDTLPTLQLSPAGVALLHVDGDWYESTKAALDAVYPRVAPKGGRVQLDDYNHWAGCRKAVDEYFAAAATNGEDAPMLHEIDGNGVWMVKGGF